MTAPPMSPAATAAPPSNSIVEPPRSSFRRLAHTVIGCDLGAGGSLVPRGSRMSRGYGQEVGMAVGGGVSPKLAESVRHLTRPYGYWENSPTALLMSCPAHFLRHAQDERDVCSVGGEPFGRFRTGLSNHTGGARCRAIPLMIIGWRGSFLKWLFVSSPVKGEDTTLPPARGGSWRVGKRFLKRGPLPLPYETAH